MGRIAAALVVALVVALGACGDGSEEDFAASGTGVEDETADGAGDVVEPTDPPEPTSTSVVCPPSPDRPSLSQIGAGISADQVPNGPDRSAIAVEIANAVDLGEICLPELEAWLAGDAPDGPVQEIVDAFVASTPAAN